MAGHASTSFFFVDLGSANGGLDCVLGRRRRYCEFTTRHWHNYQSQPYAGTESHTYAYAYTHTDSGPDAEPNSNTDAYAEP